MSTVRLAFWAIAGLFPSPAVVLAAADPASTWDTPASVLAPTAPPMPSPRLRWDEDAAVFDRGSPATGWFMLCFSLVRLCVTLTGIGTSLAGVTLLVVAHSRATRLVHNKYTVVREGGRRRRWMSMLALQGMVLVETVRSAALTLDMVTHAAAVALGFLVDAILPMKLRAVLVAREPSTAERDNIWAQFRDLDKTAETDAKKLF